ncbi:MAG: DUF6599 family protein [Phycisphaerae bacterium]|nr:DUF6599 family protein [Phycisphaerae bacterium]
MSLIARKVWQAMALGCLVLAASLAGCKATPPEEGRPAEPTGPHATLLKLFPRPGDVTDWKAAGKVEVFGPSANAEQEVQAVELDPGVEAALVRGYGYVKSALGRYERTGVGERMALRVFEMDSPSEAFGLFSLCTQGLQFPPIGLAARQGERTLGFVKGPYFVWLQYEGPGTAEPALKEFGEWVDGQIVSKGYRPAVLESFPIGSVQSERYYLHTFETLARLAFFPVGDPAAVGRRLALSPGTDVAVMGYPTTRTGVTNYLFVIRYATPADATSAYNQYAEYLEASANPAEQNVAVAPPVQTYVAGTLNAEENSIRDRLAELLTGLGG